MEPVRIHHTGLSHRDYPRNNNTGLYVSVYGRRNNHIIRARTARTHKWGLSGFGKRICRPQADRSFDRLLENRSNDRSALRTTSVFQPTQQASFTFAHDPKMGPLLVGLLGPLQEDPCWDPCLGPLNYHFTEGHGTS